MSWSRTLSFIDRVSIWTGKMVAYMLIPLVAVIFIGVIWRYLLESPLDWTHETSQFIFGGIGLLMCASLIQSEAHIRIEIVYDRLPEKGKAYLNVLTSLVMLYFIFILAWQGSVYALNSIKILEISNSPWGPYIWPIKTVIPLAAYLMFFQTLAKFIRNCYFAVQGRELA